MKQNTNAAKVVCDTNGCNKGACEVMYVSGEQQNVCIDHLYDPAN